MTLPDHWERRLAAPFTADEVQFKPGVVKGDRALALPYIDARTVQDRLDEVLGVAGWQDDYEWLPDGSVLCRLRIKIGEEWIVKVDVGGPSEQSDEGDRRKAAVSDALKRAAVKFGVGRYLYRLPGQWVDWDAQRRQFRQKPGIRDQGPGTRDQEPPRNGPPALPSTGAELLALVRRREAELVGTGRVKPGAMTAALLAEFAGEGWPTEIAAWDPRHFERVITFLRVWVGGRKPPA